MTIKLHRSLANFSSVCEIIETDSFRACSFAMDDGGRCLLDVISDPLLLQSFLESGSDDNSKDPQDGTSSESAVESPQIARYPQVSLSNHIASLENVIEPLDQQMGYSFPSDGQGFLAHNSACSIGVTLGNALIVGSPSAVPTHHHASTSRATIHHLPTSMSQSSLQLSSVPPRPLTPLSHSIRSPNQGSPSVHMPPPSPLQQIRSPLTSHTPSPAPVWSPVPTVLSPATSRAQSSMPSVAFQSHNQMLQTTASVSQIVTALSQQNQKLNMQSQPPLIIHPQTSPIPSPQQPTRLTMTSPVVTTAAVPVATPMVQIIPAPQPNVQLPVKTPHSTVRPIQPKLPQQILPKPANSATSQFVSPVVKQTNNTPVTASQRGVSVPLQTTPTSQLVIGQGQTGMFSSPQGTILLNSIIPGMGQSPFLFQGNIGNLANLQGLQLTLRPPVSATSSQALSSSGAQNNPTLIAALQGPNQPAQALFTQTKPSLHGQQTIVIPNNIASTGLTQQNLNLAQAAMRNNTIVSSASQGQGILGRSNYILSSRVVGTNQGLQLQQIQTPQGPILALAPSGTITLPHLQNATLGAPQLTSGPLQGVVGQGVISHMSLQSQHATLHQHSHHQAPSLFSTTVPLTGQIEQSPQPVVHLPQTLSAQHISATLSASHSSAIQLQQQLHSHQENPSPKPQSPPKPLKAPSVNLEELLKEHGIVPENTPPPSPDSQSPQSEDPVPTHVQVHSPIVQSPQLLAAALQPQHHVVLEQLSQNSIATSALPQMKLALAQDGSVIFQPHHAFIPSPRFSAPAKIASTMSSAVLPNIPTSMSMSIPIATTQQCTSHSHSTLLARLNSAPAIGIPEVVTSLALAASLGSCTSSSITTSTLTTTAPMLIPLTVPSLNMSNSPITTSHIVQPVTSISSVISGQIPIELCSSLPQSVNHTSNSTIPAIFTQQNMPNRLNHMIFGLQPLITSSHQISSTASNITKSAPEPLSVSISSVIATEKVFLSQSEKVSKLDPVISIADSSSSTNVSGQKLRAITPVPNDICHTETERSNQVTTVSVSTVSSRKQTITTTVTEIKCSSESEMNSTKTRSCQNTNLVNLLKQSPVHNLNVQTLTPVSASSTSHCDISKTSAASQTTVSTKIATLVNTGSVSQQKHTTPHTSNTVSPENSQQDNDDNSTQWSSLTIQPATSGATKHNLQFSKVKQPIRISSASKSALFNKQLTVDQNYAVSPDIKTPFASKRDACSRLLKYHVFNSKVPSLDEMATADQMFEKVSIQLLDKFQKMMNKYHLLQLKDSMKPCPTPECVLLERLFQEDEKAALDEDKAFVAEGKSLVLPPMPSHWLKDWNTSSSNRSSRDGSSSPDKDDSDNLEAPIIDSCIEPASPQSDMGDRSPPTLKRIVVKTSYSPERDVEESCSKKRLKVQNSPIKSVSNSLAWYSAENVKIEQKDDMSVCDKIFPLKTYDRFHCDNKDEDIITKLRKELNISPLENGDRESVVPHVDFESPECANGLADFDPPIARTESACESTLTYNNRTRTNHGIKYDLDMLGCPTDWVDYTNHGSHNTAESQAAVESILSDHHNQSELDLSDIEGLDDHLEDSQQSIHNGIRDDGEDSEDSELQYIPYTIPKNRSMTADVEGHSNEVQSAIKSILELQSDNRSYFDGNSDIMPRIYELEKTSHDSKKHCHMSPVSYVSLDEDIGMNSETDAALEEAVQSILQ